MGNIVQSIIKSVSKHTPYRINLRTKNLEVGKRRIVADGCVIGDYTFEEVDVLKKLDILYQIYKHSVPTTNETMWASKYFKALPLDELTEEDLICGESRVEARIRLEVFFLFAVVSGNLKWDDVVGNDKFFYQSPYDKDLVILREWT